MRSFLSALAWLKQQNVPYSQQLLQHVAQKSHLTLSSPCEESIWIELDGMVAMIKDNYPMDYIFGHTEINARTFHVNPHVLIPRQDTQVLIDIAIQYLAYHLQPSILDLGTGSGFIAISIAHALPHAHVTAFDISLEALKVAKYNAKNHQVLMHFQKNDWLACCSKQWHAILSNPPYLSSYDLHLPALKHEPSIALIGGPEGLECYYSIISQAQKNLYPDGWLIMEHGYQQAAQIREILTTYNYQNIRTYHDEQNHERVTLGQKSSVAKK